MLLADDDATVVGLRVGHRTQRSSIHPLMRRSHLHLNDQELERTLLFNGI